MIAKLRYLVLSTVLVNIYNSLILPYITYGLIAWGNASNAYLNKILVLQKRVLHLIYFTDRREHAIPLFYAGEPYTSIWQLTETIVTTSVVTTERLRTIRNRLAVAVHYALIVTRQRRTSASYNWTESISWQTKTVNCIALSGISNKNTNLCTFVQPSQQKHRIYNKSYKWESQESEK